MSDYVIQGGRQLHGSVTTNTSKNGAMGLLAAVLLNQQTTVLHGVPELEEVKRIQEILLSLGVKIKIDKKVWTITPPKKLAIDKLNRESALKTRSVIMFLAPFLAQVNSFKLPHTGGCALGKRSTFPHGLVAEAFGAKFIKKTKDYYISRKNIKSPGTLVLYESGDTVTENAVMLAAIAPGVTTIKMASANYQVQEVCYFLQKLGVKIEGIGTTTLKVHGKKVISKKVDYYLSEDPIESMFFIAVAATTNSAITIKRCPIEFLELELEKLRLMGWKFSIEKKYKAKNGYTQLVDIKTYKSKLSALPDKIYGRPFPGLNIDNLPFFVPIATQAEGRTFIHDWAYENRAVYFMEFAKLGASVTLIDQHRLYVDGKTKIKSAEIVAPPALRPAVVLVVAMLSADGQSILRNVYGIERGYEDLCGKLTKLGAIIKRID